MSNLYRVAPAVAETISHARDIIGFRNILAHGYADLDHNKVYNICTCAVASPRRTEGVGVPRPTIATVIECPEIEFRNVSVRVAQS